MIKFCCPGCGCSRFTLVRRNLTDVDFSQEGAIEGHPFIMDAGSIFIHFLCYECGKEVPTEQAEKMLKEVV